MNSNKKILVIGSYPIMNPKHGGQKRTAAIVSEYKKHFSVKYVSVIPGDYYLDRKSADISISRTLMQKIKTNPIFSDIICGQAISEDHKIKAKLLKIIKKYKPDIIQLEQPYMYIGLQSILKENRLHPLIINSTHNIEANMKKDIYKSSGVDHKLATLYLRLIKDTERQLSLDAILSVAVSPFDAEYLKTKLQARNVILAPNGMNRLKFNHQLASSLQQKYKRERINHLAVFVGSAHQPNLQGFMSMVGKAIGFLPYDSRIVVIGGVSDLISASMRPGVIEDVCFTERVCLLGTVNEALLAAYLYLANLIILPITDGGGSNLKTAEALLSGKHIVATSKAFRGYEDMIKLPQVHLADNPEDFKSEIIKLLDSKPPELSDSQNRLVDQVLWTNTLKDLIVRVGEL